MKCKYCGTENESCNNQCKNCNSQLYGSPYADDRANERDKSPYNEEQKNNEFERTMENEKQSKCNRWIAFTLCFICGGLGIHRFYVGKIGTGLIYLFTGGLCGIGWIVDLILIACGTFTDKYGLTLKERLD